MLDWIRQGMKESPEVLTEKIGVTMRGNIQGSLKNMEEEYFTKRRG